MSLVYLIYFVMCMVSFHFLLDGIIVYYFWMKTQYLNEIQLNASHFVFIFVHALFMMNMSNTFKVNFWIQNPSVLYQMCFLPWSNIKYQTMQILVKYIKISGNKKVTVFSCDCVNCDVIVCLILTGETCFCYDFDFVWLKWSKMECMEQV